MAQIAITAATRSSTWHLKTAIRCWTVSFASGSTGDPDLAFRFSCFNANVCKECTMLIDGNVEYACIAKLRAGLMQLDPLPNLPIVRDLVTNTLSHKERF